MLLSVCKEINWPLLTTDLKDLKAFNFQIELSVIEVMDDGKVITDEHVDDKKRMVEPVKEVALRKERWSWTLGDSELAMVKGLPEEADSRYVSAPFERFGMDWTVTLKPNVNSSGWLDLGITVLELPTESTVMSLRYRVSVEQIGLNYFSSGIFSKDQMGAYWDKERMSSKQLMAMDRLHIDLELQMVDFFDTKV